MAPRAIAVTSVSGRFALDALGYGEAAEFLLFSVGTHVVQVSLLLIPLCVLLAVVRHRLFGIEVVVNRALVYAALTLCVVGVYVLVVGYLGGLFRVEDNLIVSLFAATKGHHDGVPVERAHFAA